MVGTCSSERLINYWQNKPWVRLTDGQEIYLTSCKQLFDLVPGHERGILSNWRSRPKYWAPRRPAVPATRTSESRYK